MPGDILGLRLEITFEPRLDIHGIDIERAQDLAIGRIARCREADPLARVKERDEGQHEGPRGPRRHHHPRRIEVESVAITVMAGNAAAQFRQAKADSIPQGLGTHLCRQPVKRCTRCAGSGLAYFHMDDAPARSLGRAGGFHHVHHDEGINSTPA